MREILFALVRIRMVHAVGAGVLLALAFPGVKLAGAAWVAPGLILLCALGEKGWSVFRMGYVSGLAFWLTSLCWLLQIPVNKVFPFMGWVALSAYLAIYMGIWTWLCHGLLATLESNVLDNFASIGRLRRMAWAPLCAIIWVGLEAVRARLLTGFPWNSLGVSQFEILPLVQIASVTGVPGISFLVTWCSVALVSAGWLITKEPAARRLWTGELFLPAAVLAATWIWGASELWHKIDQKPRTTLKAALIQPSIPQELIWDAQKDTNRFARLLQQSESAAAAKPNLLVWPESAIPAMLRYDEFVLRAVTNFAVKHQIWMLVGSDDAIRQAGANAPDQICFYNSAFLVSPDGRIVSQYSKQHLVIFGEYVPLERWIPFLKKLTPIGGSFTAGESSTPFEFEVLPENATAMSQTHQKIKAGVLICFEDVFADLARKAAENGLDFLVNLTNDGWFQESAAQWQHAANAAFRAVETGRPLVRCTNNGLTCWVDAAGRIMDVFYDEKSDIHGEGFMIISIPLTEPSHGPITFFGRHGDWFGLLCLFVTVCFAIHGSVRRLAPTIFKQVKLP